MITVSIYRNTELILAAKPNEQSNVKQELMGENTLTLQFYLDIMIDLHIGDYAIVFGKTYFIHGEKLPVITKDSRFGFQYDITMVSTQYLLKNVLYFSLGSNNQLTEASFSLYGTADDFINLLIQNAARLGMTWKKGGVIQSGYKNLTFSSVDCLSALGTLAEAFGTEWYVDGFTINLFQKLTPRPYTFQYGKNKGMYDIKRSPADSSSIVTRLYVYGGTQNIPLNYRNGSTRLLLPAIADPKLVSSVSYTVVNNGNGTETITFNWVAPTDPAATAVTILYRNTGNAGNIIQANTGSKNSPRILTVPVGMYEISFRSELTGGLSVSTQQIIVYQSSPFPVLPGSANRPCLEYNTALYGIIEKTLTFDDIYPHRTGKVSGVDALDPYSFVDTSIDFDLNSQLLPGTSAKVTFNTGQLAGYTFEIKEGGYNHSLKKVTLLKNKDEKTLDIPSSLLKPAIGDEYVFIDIVMPQSYIDAAEALLLTKAQDYLTTYSAPVYTYSVDCDPKYFRLNKIALSYGDVVKIIDTDLGINRNIRILSVVKQLEDEFNYQITLGEAVSQGLIAQINNAITGNSNGINNINDAFDNNPLFEGLLRGEIKMPDLPTASDVSSMKAVYIDSNGKLWKAT